MKAVELVDVEHQYGDQSALSSVSVTFTKEKITAVIGRSGSGKSTLLKSINGLVKPSRGKILIDGTPIDYENILPMRRRIGYVVQGNALFPHMTVADNISIPAKVAGLEESSRTRELLDMTGLPYSYAVKYPAELSGGEQQRVALCRALYLNPPILLMDEPFGSLDPVTRRALNAKIIELRKTSQLTMIIVTHDVAEANRIADDMLVLDNGQVQQFGSRSEVIQSPANSIVSELIQASLQ